MRRILLIDNSNGRTKCVPCEGGEPVAEPRAIATDELSEESWHGLTADWHCTAALLSTVVPAAAQTLRAYCRQHNMPLERVSIGGQNLVSFAGYEGCATLGDDRLVNALAVASAGVHRPTLVIDAGTATTLDVLLPGMPPRFAGGAIAPGFPALACALHNCAAQLPLPEPVLPRTAIGSTTATALQSGVVLGYQGLLQHLVRSMEQELGQSAELVITGGDAAPVARLLGRHAAVEPRLTLRGLACYAEQAHRM